MTSPRTRDLARPTTGALKDLVDAGQLTRTLIAAANGDPVPELDDTDPDELTAEIMARILAAGNLEDAFDNSGSTATKLLVGQPMLLRDVRLRASGLEDDPAHPNRLKVYAHLEVAIDGELRVLNTGSPRIMAQACYAKDRGHLTGDGLPVKIIEVARARPGQNPPLGLELVLGKAA